MTTEVCFDNTKRIDIILKEKINDICDILGSNGYIFSSNHASRTHSRLLAVKEQVSGSTYLRYLKNVLQNESIEEVSKQLKETLDIILSTSTCEGFINCIESDMEKVAPKLEVFIEELNKLSSKKLESDFSFIDKYIEEESKKENVFFAFDGQTNFLASSAKIDAFNKEIGKLSVAANLLENEFINLEIRQKLGAYGAWVNVNEVSGKLTFITYRDGTPAESFNAIKRTLETSSEQITDQMVDNAILQVAKSLDRPEAPSTRGVSDYILHFPYEYKQLIRDAAFTATKEEVQKEIEMMKNLKYYTTIFGAEIKAPEGFIVEKF
jgi:Zn-dependent M16 (insulinase) family peptidase